MTLEELIAREQIRHTIATYNRAGDEDDPDRFAGCFMPEAELIASSAHLRGREAIRAWKASNAAFTAGRTGKPPPFRAHHVSSIHIELTSGDAAAVRACWLVITDVGPDHSGLYLDRFKRCEDRWLIEHRRIETLWMAERSYMRKAGPRSSRDQPG